MTANLKITESEYGFNHKFIFPVNTDLTWISGFRLIINDKTGDKLNITSGLSVTQPNIISWAVQNGQTNYNGRYNGILILTSGSRREEIHFNADFVPSKE